MWQMIACKARFIEQAFTGDDSVRTIEDVSEASQYAMALAMSGPFSSRVCKADVERLLGSMLPRVAKATCSTTLLKNKGQPRSGETGTFFMPPRRTRAGRSAAGWRESAVRRRTARRPDRPSSHLRTR